LCNTLGKTEREHYDAWAIDDVQPPPAPVCNVGFAVLDHLGCHFAGKGADLT